MNVIQPTLVDNRDSTGRRRSRRRGADDVQLRTRDYERAFGILERCSLASCVSDFKVQLVDALCEELGLDHVSFFSGPTFQTTFSDATPVVHGYTAKMLPEYQERWYRYDLFSTPPALRMLMSSRVASLSELSGAGVLPAPAAAYVRQFLVRTWDMELAAALRIDLPHGHTALIGMFDRSPTKLGPYEVAILRRVAEPLSSIARGLPLTRNHAALRALSVRQREVVRLVADGLSNAEIAETLSLAEDSVKKYISRILGATGCRSRLELALLARSAV